MALQAARLRLGLDLQARSALASFCARVSGFALGFVDVVVFTTTGAAFPLPENVALAGAPKIPGWGIGAARHESAVVHAGGKTAAAVHGDSVEQACASYMSYALSMSCEASWALVRKNTSFPLSLASTNAASSPEAPEETRPTQPPDLALNVTLDVWQLPIPAGSYS
ncbi:MAG TPA: hypothetical protein VMU55_04220 [Solirubrobacteraceae bacterium]|nr:hypothetical protein [Solirubrobacteraceae bacterium]